MIPQFHEIYQRLYENFGQELSDPRQSDLVLRTKDAIERAISELESPEIVRADAKLFLLANCYQLIALPLNIGQDLVGISQESLMDTIYSDAKTILDNAERLARQRGQDQDATEISGHIVVDTVSSFWNDIRSVWTQAWSD